MTFNATRTKVHNRGLPPIEFLTRLVEWVKSAPSDIFTPRANQPGETDIYTSVKPVIGPTGPWTNMLNRRSAMIEVLRVLAGFESSWKPNTGADSANPAERDDETFSAGLWQISYNSRGFGADLREMLIKNGVTNGKLFQAKMKEDFNFAAEYTARLLRHTIRHNGPVKNGYIHTWLSRAAVAEFEQFIS